MTEPTPEKPSARKIAERMIRVAAQHVEAMPIREATPRERRLLGMEDYDELLDEVVGLIDTAVITVTWPEIHHGGTVLPDLLALTEGDDSWTWDVCICCGSTNITHRAFWVHTTKGVWEINRVAWCGNDDAEGERWGCQGDRRRMSDLIYVGADNRTRPSTGQADHG